MSHSSSLPGLFVRIQPCSLGWTLIAISMKGVRAIFLGGTPEAVAHEFAQTFPDTTKQQPAEAHTLELVSQVINLLDGASDGTALRLDIDGAPFSRSVWAALQAIPVGQTRSYRDIAVALGRPTASRAVARACASNVLALAIPCHRVVRSDGALSGYRWGIERKRLLLEREKSMESPVAARLAHGQRTA
jgi:AraC family transcriptional regulator of adaptative response/methylated-DNA-[protein]-cysteine methyltransferase